MKKLTPYQESLLTPKRKSLKRHIFSWAQVAFTALLCFGLYHEANKTLPTGLHGWLMLGVYSYVLVNVALIPFIGLVRAFIAVLNWTLKQASENPFDQEAQKQAARCRTVFTELLKTGIANIATGFRFVVDLATDCLLFVMLVTADHPFLAVLHVVGVGVQHWFARTVKRASRAIVEKLDDPLEAEGKVDIDDLMNKLTQPENQ